MGLTLYIDPGKFHAGVSLFQENGTLLDAALLQAPSKNPAQACKELGDEALRFLGRRFVHRIGCEKPSFWRQGGTRGDPNSILDLMATNGAILDAVPAHERFYIPVGDWKKQVPKPKNKSEPYIIEERVRKRLAGRELTVLGDNPNHNVVDAIGIGLWDLKRM